MKKITRNKWFKRVSAVMLVLLVMVTAVALSSQQTKAASMTWGATDEWQFNPDYNHNETPVTDSAGRSPSSSYDLYYNLVGGNSYDQVNHTSYQGNGNASEDANNKNARGYAIVLRDDADGSWVYVGNSGNDWRATGDSNAWNGMYVTREVVQVNDNQSALIKMVIHNTNSFDKTASVATSTDLEVGGDDNAYLQQLKVKVAGKDNDQTAGFTTTNQYMTGVAENKKISLNYYFKYNSYISEAMQGVSCEKVNIWYGSYAERWQNLWNDSEEIEEVNTKDLHGGVHADVDFAGRPLIDTGFSASWQGVKVPAGGTATVAYALTAGSSAGNRTIRYDANGGSGVMLTDTKAYLGSYTIRENGFTSPAGKFFAGWSNQPNGSVVYNAGNSITVTENMTLYAVWESSDVFVNYLSNGADNGKTDTMISYNTTWSDTSLDVTDYKKTGFSNSGIWSIKAVGKAAYKTSGSTFNVQEQMKRSYTTIRTRLNNSSAVNINGASTANGANVQLWNTGNSNDPADKFAFHYEGEENGTKYWSIRNVISGKVLDMNTDTYNVQLWEYNGNANQLWTLDSAGDGYFYIRSKYDSSRVLDVAWASTEDGADITAAQKNGGKNQQWCLWDISIMAAPVFTNNNYKVDYNADGGTLLDENGNETTDTVRTYEYDRIYNFLKAKRAYTVSYETNGGTAAINSSNTDAPGTFNGWNEQLDSNTTHGEVNGWDGWSVGTWNWAAYYNGNPDLLRATNNTYDTMWAILHYRTYGISEKRQFNGNSYWLPSVKFRNLTANGGTVNVKANYTNGSVTLPTATKASTTVNGVKTDYTLEGWYSDKGLTKRVGGAGDTYTPSSSIILYAKYTTTTTNLNYKVTIDPDGGTYVGTNGSNGTTKQELTYTAGVDSYLPISNLNNSQKAVVGTNNTIGAKAGTYISAPVKSGYIFEGWYVGENQLTARTVSAGLSVYILDVSDKAENITVKAKWSKDPTVTWTVKHYFQDVDGTYPTTDSIEKRETYTGKVGEKVTGVSWLDKTDKEPLSSDYWQPALNKVGGSKTPTQSITLSADASKNVISFYYPRAEYAVNVEYDSGILYANSKSWKCTDARSRDRYRWQESVALSADVLSGEGYDAVWDGWVSDDVELTDSNKTLAIISSMPAKDVTVKATTKVKYTINYLLENADGTWTIKDTVTGEAKTDSEITGTVKKSTTGTDYNSNYYVIPEEQTITLSPKSSENVIEYKYYRKTFKVDLSTSTGISSTSHKSEATNTTKTAYRWGEVVKLDCNVQDGYSFKDWRTTGTTTPASTTKAWSYTMSNKDLKLTAYANTINYTISYNLDGGSLPSGVSNPTSYTVTSNDIKLNNPKKSGYIFTGWSGTGITGTQVDVTIKKGSTGNRSYTANWKEDKVKCIINYWVQDLGGKNYTKDSSVTIDKLRDQVVKVSDYSKDITGFSYCKAESGGKPVASVILTADSTTLDLYYNRNSYVLTVDPNGTEWVDGGKSYTSSVNFTMKYQETKNIADPIKTGYHLANWVFKPNNTGASINSSKVFTMGHGGVTISPNMEANKITVKYDANGGNSSSNFNIDVAYDSQFNLYNNEKVNYLGSVRTPFTRENCRFTGWKSSEGNSFAKDWSGKVTVANGFPASGSITMYAQWETDVTIQIYEQYVYKGTNDISGLSKGYAGTDHSSDLDYYLADAFTRVSDLGVSFTYEPEDRTGFVTPPSVTIDVSEGSPVIKVYYDRKSYSIDDPSNPDASDNRGGNANNISIWCGAGIVDVSGTNAKQTYKYGEPVSLQAIVKKGYHWHEDGDDCETSIEGHPTGWVLSGVDDYTTDKTKVTFNMPANNVSIAVRATNNSYHISYSNVNSGASSVPSGNIEYQLAIYDEPIKLKEGGYTLKGWDLVGWLDSAFTAEGNNTYDLGATVSNLTTTNKGTVTLYANWFAHRYRVDFHSNKPADDNYTVDASNEVVNNCSSSSMFSNTVNYNGTDGWLKYDTSYTLYKNGYQFKVGTVNTCQIYLEGWSFLGWYEGTGNPENKGDFILDGASISNLTDTNGATIDLYAKWTQNDFKIVYNYKGGYEGPDASGNFTKYAEQPLNYDMENVTIRVSPTRYGYKFKGWNWVAVDVEGNTVVKRTFDENEVIDKVTLIQGDYLTPDENGNKPYDPDYDIVFVEAEWEQLQFTDLSVGSTAYDTKYILTKEGYREFSDVSNPVQQYTVTRNGNVTRVK